MTDQTQTGELDVTGPGGIGFRSKGYRLMDVVCLVALLLSGYIALMIYNHAADAKDTSKTVAEVLKDSNKEIAQALKEAQAQTAEAIRQMAEQQRRQNEIGREQTCLLTLPPDRRTNAGEFCKRLSRERDR